MIIKNMKIHYEPEKCEHCGQTLTYLLPVDRGAVDILRSISVAVYRKNINVVHPRKEMEIKLALSKSEYASMIRNGNLTSNQVGNLSRLRFHGLIAAIDGNPGNYCMTTKGAQFLKGRRIPRFAIISKAQGRQVGYYLPEEQTVTIKELVKYDDAYWEGINFDIIEGRIIKDLPITKQRTPEEKTLKLL
jgi:hypothetical protein